MIRFTIAFILGLPLYAAAQDPVALPAIVNFSRQAYNGGTQNWRLAQGNDGVLYVANNEGLLTYDGTYWSTYPLPNKTIVRSLAVGTDGVVYVGGQNEMGCFVPSDSGKLMYRDFKALLPRDNQSFDDVWSITVPGTHAYYRIRQFVFDIHDGQAKAMKADVWRYMDTCGGMLYAQEINAGLLRYSNGQFVPVPQGNKLSGAALITGMVAVSGDSTLVATLWDGLYWLTPEGIAPMVGGRELRTVMDAGINAMALLSNGDVAVATRNSGVYVFNTLGRILQHYYTGTGLQNQYVHHLIVDKMDNIWAGLDNGISYIGHSDPIRRIVPDKESAGAGYAALVSGGNLWLGTNTGLYKASFDPAMLPRNNAGDFSLVPQSDGQVWGLADINGQIYMGHHEGAFRIETNRVVQLDQYMGYWRFFSVDAAIPTGKVAAGTYRGVKLFNLAGGTLQEIAYKPFESARFLEYAHQKIWVSHPYKGIFCLDLAGDGRSDTFQLKKITEKQGIPSLNKNYIFTIKNRLVAATPGGIKQYDARLDSFVAYPELDDVLPLPNIRFMKEDPAGNIWVVYEKNLCVLDFEGGTPRLITMPEFTNNLLSGFESMYYINPRTIILGAEKGFFLLDYTAYKSSRPPLVPQVRRVRLMGSSETEIYSGHLPAGGIRMVPEIEPYWKTIHFDYSAPAYGQQPVVEYSVMLSGYDKEWSIWGRRTEKEYTNLPPGTYTFHVRARDNMGHISQAATYRFEVLPPWYLTGIAYVCYLLAAAGLLFLAYRWQKATLLAAQRRHEQAQAQLRYKQQLALEMNEKEIIKLRNEKLEAELELQNAELAQATMHLVQKAEVLNDIKEELLALTRKYTGSISVTELKKMIKTLGEDTAIETEWDQFAHHFDKVHSNFLTRLKQKHPDLTPGEMKLCAYLRMNLSSKEIAQLMHITIKSVELSRYRLRKKLGLGREESLFDFITAAAGEPASV